MTTYEPCVLGPDGRCTRWSHTHTPDGCPPELAAEMGKFGRTLPRRNATANTDTDTDTEETE